MIREPEARINEVADQIANEGMIVRASQVREGAIEISRQRHEIERLKEQLASLQASSGYEASIMQLEVERLQALLRRHQVAAWCEEDSDLAIETRAALEAKS